MSNPKDAAARWTKLDGTRGGFMDRCEQYARYTIPRLCLPNGYDQNSADLRHDWQAVGAQCVNHLANKLMLAMFAPSRPFSRYDPSDAMAQDMESAGVSRTKLAEALAVAEMDAVRKLDQMGSRPKLFELTKHLIVTGNALMKLEKDKVRAFGVKRYCVKRSQDGTVQELLLRFDIKFDELDETAKDQLRARYTDDSKVTLYHWIKRDGDGWTMTQWVDKDQLLDKKYSGRWTAETFPYVVLTWDLTEGDDYGTGLVELYEGDFAALSALSEGQIKAALMASEFRWLVNPGGLTKPEDLARSENGDALPGMPNDITPLTIGKGMDLQIMSSMGSEYINRIGRGFLLVQGSIRNSERTTAEEVRLLANELETGLGGVYSRLAVDWQLPIAYWLAKMVDTKLNGKTITPTIVTGLDALSRSSDLENLKLFLADCAAVGALPPAVLGRVRLGDIISALATARGLNSSQYLLTDAEVAQAQAQQRDEANQQAATEAGIAAGAQAVQQ